MSDRLRGAIFLAAAVGCALAAAARASAQQPVPQKWEFGIAVRSGSGPCSGVQGTFPIPGEWPEQSVKVASESITPSVRHRVRTIEGLTQVVLEIAHVPTGGEAECFITYEVVKRPIAPPLDKAALVIPKDPPRDVKKYLGPSPLIESTNAKVRTLARELTEGKESAWEQVDAIAAGVRERVKFEQDPKNKFKGALGALRDGQADREDLTATFIAVCRAAKIPARMVWALDYCYAEFYLEETPTDEATADGDAAAKAKKAAKSQPPQGAW
jgi:transglutaminase-like putative cysteine protease